MAQRTCGGVSRIDNDTIWPISPHTVAKHHILMKYVQAWAAIFATRSTGSNDRRFIYIDGFAGPGEYSDGEDGSPVVVLKSLKGHRSANKFLGTEFFNIFIEKNSNRAENLEKVIKERIEPVPSWLKYRVINGDFNSQLNSILSEVEEGNKSLAPCFCFVDPFGWSDIDYDVLSRVMVNKKAEILITFMAGYVERFVFDPMHIPSLEKLYSTQQLDSIRASKNDENLVTKYFLENLTQKIKSNSGVSELFTISFAAYNNHNGLEYYLVYLTKHCKGFGVMKEAMFSSAKDGSYKFSDFDFDPNQKTLVDYGQEKIWLGLASSDCYNVLVEVFGKGKKIPIDQVKSTIICRTKWVYRAEILAKLEELDKIKVKIDKRRKGTYPDRGFIVLN